MKKLVIKPYRQNMGMDATRAQEIWTSLRSAIHEIFSHNASQLSFEELYRNSYNLVLHKHGDLLYNGVIDVITEQLQATSSEVAGSSDELLLVVLYQKWHDHKLIMTMVRDILMYMDRTYVNQKRKTPVYDAGLLIFRDHVVRNSQIRDRLRSLLLENVARERQGEVIDRNLMKSVLQMLVDLGIHSTSVYDQDFETYFLDQTLEFYRHEAQTLLDEATCPEYLARASQRLSEEANRVTHYLHKSTEPKLKSLVETQLIKHQASALVSMPSSGCVALFREKKTDALRKMYSLFRRVPSTLPSISDCVYNYIVDAGHALMEAQKDPEVALGASAFVDKLLGLRSTFATFLSDCFYDDSAFHKAMKQGFEAFMNPPGVPLCAALLATYLDELLRSKMKMEQVDLDAKVVQVIALFRYLEDKDVFEDFYKKLLAKRLLQHRTTSEESERTVLVKLKAECGYQFTSKLEGMLNDVDVSKDTMEQYREFVGKRSLALNAQVLTSGFWPSEVRSSCVLPQEMQDMATSFETYYLSRHNGRKLEWAPSLGNVDVKAVLGGKKVELVVTTYQAVILDVFNGGDAFGLAELLDRTRIEKAELKRHLISLCTPKCRVLLKSSKAKRIDEETDVFSVNDAFKSKLHRVKVPLVSQKEESLTKASGGKVDGMLPPTVAEDRKHLVEAAIVRIMKTRKQLQHNELMSEVTRQMSGRFQPTPQLIKLRIESLIEREYLARTAHDRRVYNYLA